jgi:hypothetical protein
MNRNTAIIVTIASAILCGCPGLILVIMGAMAAMGSQMPEAMAGNNSTPEEVLLGAGIFACFGLILIGFPVVIGFLSIGFTRKSEPAVNEQPPV